MPTQSTPVFHGKGNITGYDKKLTCSEFFERFRTFQDEKDISEMPPYLLVEDWSLTGTPQFADYLKLICKDPQDVLKMTMGDFATTMNGATTNMLSTEGKVVPPTGNEIWAGTFETLVDKKDPLSKYCTLEDAQKMHALCPSCGETYDNPYDGVITGMNVSPCGQNVQGVFCKNDAPYVDWSCKDDASICATMPVTKNAAQYIKPQFPVCVPKTANECERAIMVDAKWVPVMMAPSVAGSQSSFTVTTGTTKTGSDEATKTVTDSLETHINTGFDFLVWKFGTEETTKMDHSTKNSLKTTLGQTSEQTLKVPIPTGGGTLWQFQMTGQQHPKCGEAKVLSKTNIFATTQGDPGNGPCCLPSSLCKYDNPHWGGCREAAVFCEPNTAYSFAQCAIQNSTLLTEPTAPIRAPTDAASTKPVAHPA